jgi:hypothetical protein
LAATFLLFLTKSQNLFAVSEILRIFALEHCEDGSWDLPAVSSDASVEVAVRHRGNQIEALCSSCI